MKQKVLFFINTISCGGAEKSLLNAVNMLPKDKYEFTVVSVTRDDSIEAFPKYVKSKTIIKTKNKLLKKIYSRIVYKLLPKGLFCKLFLKGNYDVAVAYLEGFPTRVIAKHNNCDTKIAFLHCGSFDDLLLTGYSSKAECIKEYRTFSKVCFVSEMARDNFFKMFSELSNSFVINNIIDVSYILKRSVEKCEDIYRTDAVKIVSVGRLANVKGFERLISVAKKLEDKYDFQINIIGDGELKEDLSDLIEKLNVKSVKLLGYKDNPYSLVKQADIYVCSSFSEGYNTAVIEALVLDVPVVTTNCAGMSEILNNGEYGLIVENDEEALKLGLEAMLRDNKFLTYKTKIKELNKNVFITKAINNYTELLDNK